MVVTVTVFHLEISSLKVPLLLKRPPMLLTHAVFQSAILPYVAAAVVGEATHAVTAVRMLLSLNVGAEGVGVDGVAVKGVAVVGVGGKVSPTEVGAGLVGLSVGVDVGAGVGVELGAGVGVDIGAGVGEAVGA
jgi:hypothetical protein